MATLYKRGGKRNKGGTWYVQYHDENGQRRTVRGCRDKEASLQISRKLEADVALRKAGVRDARTDRYAVEGRKLIAIHLEDFRRDMLARGVTPEYATKTHSRVTKLFDLAGICYLSDVKRPSTIQSAIAQLRDAGRAAKTLNDILAGAKQFCRWARRDGRLAENPIDHLKGLNTAVDRRHDRRALADSELRRLFQAASNGPKLQKCSGPERALIYKVSVLTGLRKNEIASLKKASFDLDGTPPTVTVEAAFSKHRRKDTLPLPDELVKELRRHLADKDDDEPAFRVPRFAYRALKRDLEAAQIEYRDNSGRVVDFHAFRHTYVTRLVKAGVNTKTTQLLARHSDPRLTLGVYSHIEIIDQAAAIKKLPPLETDDIERDKQKILLTGTHGAENVGKSVGSSVGSCAALCDISCQFAAREEKGEKKPKPSNLRTLGLDWQGKALSDKVSKNVELRGIEPLTS
ncbi:MAG: site-specific integrase [bacterium]